MTRDIVDRLKETALMLPRNGYVSVGHEATEAADEITALRARLEAAEAMLSEAVKAGMLEGAKTLQERGSDGWAEHLMAEYASVNVEAITELADDPETIARIVASLKEGRG